MSNESKLNLCLPSAGQEEDWRQLYEAAFPVDERMTLSDLLQLLADKKILLHRTTDETGGLLCFSIVTPMSNFALLAYIATDQSKRSGGVGSKHMRALLDILKAAYPAHLGLFLEIESTREKGLSAEDEKVRMRRLQFYLKLGAKRLSDKDYILPSFVKGAPPRQGELLWFEFQNTLDDDPERKVGPVVCEIYTRSYGVPTTDGHFTRVMGQFPAVDQATCQVRASAPPEGAVDQGGSVAKPVPAGDAGAVSSIWARFTGWLAHCLRLIKNWLRKRLQWLRS